MGCNNSDSTDITKGNQFKNDYANNSNNNVIQIHVKEMPLNSRNLKDKDKNIIKSNKFDENFEDSSLLKESLNYNKKFAIWESMCKTDLSNPECLQIIIDNTNSRMNFNKSYINNLISEASAEIGLSNFMKQKVEKFKKRIKLMPPSCFRWISWKTVTRFLENFEKDKYYNLLHEKYREDVVNTILKDVDRTFPDQKLFFKENDSSVNPIGYSSLLNILKAYSILNPQVGYCQGMNFIGGFLLLISGNKEEESFWVFSNLMENYLPHDKLRIKGLESLFQNYFPLLKVYNYLIGIELEKKCQKVKEYLEHLQFYELLWYHKWILTMFLYTFSITVCIRIWDYLLAEGFSFFIPLVIEIVKYLEKEILSSDFNQLCELFESMRQKINDENIEVILKNAAELDIDWDLLEKERKYIEIQIKEEIDEQLMKIKNKKHNLNQPENETGEKLEKEEKEEKGENNFEKVGEEEYLKNNKSHQLTKLKPQIEENKTVKVVELKRNKTDAFLRRNNVLYSFETIILKHGKNIPKRYNNDNVNFEKISEKIEFQNMNNNNDNIALNIKPKKKYLNLFKMESIKLFAKSSKLQEIKENSQRDKKEILEKDDENKTDRNLSKNEIFEQKSDHKSFENLEEIKEISQNEFTCSAALLGNSPTIPLKFKASNWIPSQINDKNESSPKKIGQQEIQALNSLILKAQTYQI